jgi:hypothetical protein
MTLGMFRVVITILRLSVGQTARRVNKKFEAALLGSIPCPDIGLLSVESQKRICGNATPAMRTWRIPPTSRLRGHVKTARGACRAIERKIAKACFRKYDRGLAERPAIRPRQADACGGGPRMSSTGHVNRKSVKSHLQKCDGSGSKSVDRLIAGSTVAAKKPGVMMAISGAVAKSQNRICDDTA